MCAFCPLYSADAGCCCCSQVLVKLRKAQDQTAGGLFVAGSEVEKPKEGLVIAAGPGKTDPVTGKLLPNPVKEGDLVLLADFTGENVDYNREKHLFVDADLLLGSFANKEVTVSAFQPLGDRVLVEVAEAEQETATGIAIATADDAEEDNSGVVAAVGAGRINQNGDVQPVAVTVGESVMYARRMGVDATLEGKHFKVVSERDCLAKW